MRLRPILLAAAILISLPAGSRAAGMEALRVVASDDRGVTLRLDLPEPVLTANDPSGRMLIDMGGLPLMSMEGRPKLPYVSALIAIPPGARATASLQESGADTFQEPVAIAIGERAIFKNDLDGLGLIPWREEVAAIRGVWPASPVEVSEPFSLRHQRMVRVAVYPCRYDVERSRLGTRRSITVRVAFVGGTSGTQINLPSGDDRHWEPVLEQTILNYDQGRSLREAPRAHVATRTPLRPTAAARAARPGTMAAAAFDESEPEVRVKIDTTGVYWLDYDLLAANGYPANVPVAEVSVHRHEFIEDAAVPYVTLELPIEVDDVNTNGTFDSGDRIVAYVQTWQERTQPTRPLRLWGDGEVVYATRLAGGTGLRMARRSGWLAQALSPLASFPCTRHFEKNFTYYNTYSTYADTTIDPYRWTAGHLYYDRPETLLFDTQNIDTSKPVTVSVDLAGAGDDFHFNWVQVANNTNLAAGLRTRNLIVDSLYWAGRGEIQRQRSLSGTALSEGRTNALTLWGKSLDLPPDPTTNNFVRSGLDYFDVSYWRGFRSISDYLECNSAGVSGPLQIDAETFIDSSLTRAYDVSDSTAPVRLIGVQQEEVAGRFRLKLQDDVPAGTTRRYVVCGTGRAVDPSRVSPVVRDPIDVAQNGDYLLIVPEVWRAAVAPLVTLRQSQGFNVIVTSIESLSDQFNGGRPSAYGIKRYLRYGYLNWDARFVLLVGDGSEDPMNYSQRSSIDWVPTQRVVGTLRAFSGGESFLEGIPSDNWFGWCMDCTDPSLAPKLPDMYVGRLPVNTTAEAASVVAKIVNYEQFAADQTWRHDMTLASDDMYSGESFFGSAGPSTYCRRNYEDVFRDINTRARNVVLNDAGLVQSQVELFNLSYYLPNQAGDLVPCSQSPDTCRCDRATFESRARLSATPELFNRLNAGKLWWNYQGHANESVLSHESFYRSNGRFAGTDHNSLLNDGKPFLFTAFSCHPNSFAHYDEYGPVRGGPSLGEMMLTRPNGRGAIASWGSTGYELLPAIGADHINLCLARALFYHPPRDLALGDGGARVVLGEAIATAVIENYKAKIFDPNERDIFISYCLLGDPATRLSIGAPQAKVTANTQPVNSGTTVRLRTGGDTLDVEADLVSTVRLDSIAVLRTDATGPPVLLPPSAYTLTPAFVAHDTGAASWGGRRYRLSLLDSLRIDSYRYTLRTVDRYALASSFDVVLAFETVLLADGAPVNDMDVVSPNAAMSMLVLSPAPLTLPGDLTLRVGGVVQNYTPVRANGDTTGREWLLSWTHPPFPFGETDVELEAAGGALRIHRFQVNVTGAELRIVNPIAFPNPFEDELGVQFSFSLESGSPVDLLIRVFTVTGKRVYEQKLMQLTPGYHQIPWSGMDAEGSTLANGMYFYRLVARNASSSTFYEGRLAKLRKPHRVEDETATP